MHEASSNQLIDLLEFGAKILFFTILGLSLFSRLSPFLSKTLLNTIKTALKNRFLRAAV
jgi:hypothetical protein